MNRLQIFNNPDFGTIRTLEENGNILFCGSDVAKALGYAKPNNAINAHCKGTLKRGTPTAGGVQDVAFIPEGDLYRLIVNSKLPSAEKFERWVFDQVLPTIRKTGGYSLPQSLPEALRLAADLAEKNAVLSQTIGELQPKADYTDRILQNKALVTITQIAKDYGMSGSALNQLLHSLGVQYKQAGQWLLYAKYHGMGYTHSATVNIEHNNGMQDVRMNTKWTQKGRLFLYDLLKINGVLPVIER